MTTVSANVDSVHKKTLEIDYYKLNKIDNSDLREHLTQATEFLCSLSFCSIDQSILKQIFDAAEIRKFMILLSKLPVFSKEFARNFQHNLELLSILKKHITKWAFFQLF